jgi:hypothetical protein
MNWRDEWDSDRRRELERQRIERMKRRIEQRDPPEDERPKLDTRAPSPLSADQIDERIQAAIEDHYQNFTSEILSRLTAHTLDEGEARLQHATRRLESEIAKLEAEVHKLQALAYRLQAENAERALAQADKSAPAAVDSSLLRHRTHVN